MCTSDKSSLVLRVSLGISLNGKISSEFINILEVFNRYCPKLKSITIERIEDDFQYEIFNSIFNLFKEVKSLSFSLSFANRKGIEADPLNNIMTQAKISLPNLLYGFEGKPYDLGERFSWLISRQEDITRILKHSGEINFDDSDHEDFDIQTQFIDLPKMRVLYLDLYRQENDFGCADIEKIAIKCQNLSFLELFCFNKEDYNVLPCFTKSSVNLDNLNIFFYKVMEGEQIHVYMKEVINIIVDCGKNIKSLRFFNDLHTLIDVHPVLVNKLIFLLPNLQFFNGELVRDLENSPAGEFRNSMKKIVGSSLFSDIQICTSE